MIADRPLDETYTAEEREILSRHPTEGLDHFAHGWDRDRVIANARAVIRTDEVLRSFCATRLRVTLFAAVPNMSGPGRKAGSVHAIGEGEDATPASPDGAALLRRIVEKSGFFGYVGLPCPMFGGRVQIRPVTIGILIAPAHSATLRAAAAGLVASCAADDARIVAELRS